MKAFSLSLFALILLIGCVTFNSIYVWRISTQMKETALEIKSSPSLDRLGELESIWQKHRLLISISVPHKESDEFEKELLVLRAKLEAQDIEIDESIDLVLRAIEEIETHGTVSLDNVL